MADIVDEIKNRLDIVALISQHVQLKKAGVNYKGLCPFHNEKTSSFIVSPEKQIFHCFGCNKGGDAFKFIMEYEGVTFPEAIEILADSAGVKIENIEKVYKKSKVEKSEKDEYFKANDLACDFFEKQLHGTKDGKKVLEYLYKRGLTKETIEEFRIGFAPDEYDSLHPLLLKKGIGKDILIRSGFVSQKEIGGNEVYDKYRARLMFPVFDYFGRVCGFGGRALKKEQVPKYLNSSENPVYNKSRVLYGLSHAKQHIKEQNGIILVEGYFDMILPYQDGVKNVVATSGTALTNDHVRMIKRLTTNVTSCFDTDSAGFEATKRAYTLCQAEGISIKTVQGLSVKDPADLVKESGGKFKEFIEKAVDFVSFYFGKLTLDNNVSTFDGLRAVMKEILPILKKMAPSERDFYVRDFSKKINVNERSLYDELSSFKLPTDHPSRSEAKEPVSKPRISVQEIVLALLLKNPSLSKVSLELLNEDFFEQEAKTIYKELVGQYNSARLDLQKWNFDDVLAKFKEKIDVLILYAEERYADFSDEVLEQELGKLIKKMNSERKTGRIKEIEKELEYVDNMEDKKKRLALLVELGELTKNK